MTFCAKLKRLCSCRRHEVQSNFGCERVHIFCLRTQEKNSSMELAVIWGHSHFSHSDFTHSDFGHSDFTHSDFTHSDFTHFFVKNSYFFPFNIHNLGTHLVHTQIEQIQPNGSFTHCFTTISIQHQNNCPISIFLFFYQKHDFLTQTLGPPKNHIKFFKNQKSNVTTQTPIQQTTFHQYTSFTKFLYFLRSTEPFLHPYPIFSTFLNLNFLTWRTPKFKVPEILPSTLSPTWIELKEPKRSNIDSHFDYQTGVHILLEDPAWFDFACSDFTHFFQKLTNRTKLLKSPARWKRQLTLLAGSKHVKKNGATPPWTWELTSETEEQFDKSVVSVFSLSTAASSNSDSICFTTVPIPCPLDAFHSVLSSRSHLFSPPLFCW